MKIAIIGAGWYGCHLAICLIEHGHDIVIYEKNKIFSGSSSKNQNRLHLGFHYPRSKKTRDLCKNGYEKFENKYTTIAKNVSANKYYISKNSILDFETFCGIFNHENIKYVLSNNNLNNTQGCISVNEKVIDSIDATQFFND